MKIELLDYEKLIATNNIREITSPRLITTKNMPDPEGILSNEIFGVSKNDRRDTFGWIDLRGTYLHPHIYGNIMKRGFKSIIYIISGQRKFSTNENGTLIEDEENGWTGLSGLYDNWDKINWSKQSSKNERSIKLLSRIRKDQAFISKLIIIPPAYRDISLAGTKDSSDHVHELNKYYVALFREISLISDGGLFLRSYRQTQMAIQEKILEIFDYLKGQLKGKTGLIKKYLIGKSVDYGTRAVISAPLYNNETIDENMVDIEHTALPIAQCCSTFMPFVESWLKNFFTREIINDPTIVTFYDPEKGKEIVATLTEPEVQFSDKSIQKLINDYVFNPNNRYRPITVDAIISGTKKDQSIKAFMILKGKKILKNNVQQVINRVITVTDILYIACVDVCEKRHVMVTRYPVGTDKGLFFNKIRVQSTKTHIHVILNGKEYPFYPDIRNDIPADHIGVQFIDTTVFSNSLLDGMGGDYDGDQVSIRGIHTDEANLEAEEIMNRKMTALNITGGNSRVVSKEVFNSYYELTKIGPGGKPINSADERDYLSTTPDGFTRTKISKMFADTVDINNGRDVKKRKSKHNTWDTMTIPTNYFYEGQPETKTTVGRFLFNKYVLEGAGVIGETKMILDVINKSGLGNVDDTIGTDLYLEDKITRQQFNAYINRRDNLGYWLNGMLAHTISEKMLKPLREVEKLKAELCKKYEKEIAEGNIDVMTDISNQCVELAEKLLDGDPGMDLYLSGDLDFGNNYKNNSILKGPVPNKIDNKMDFISSSFMDGIEVKDLPAHANSILTGQYPASIATQVSGYMGKRLMALLQMMEVDEPGTDCGSKALIPIMITEENKKFLVNSYFNIGGQLQLLTKENVDSHVGKILLFRSPMSCLTNKICSVCAGELFYKLGVTHAGLTSTQLSHSALNLALKSKHSQIIDLYHIDPDNIIQDIN